ncbi:hypothetical protein TWF694_002961 [Orbilia ellipsospora]|uniref:Clr5 domain-containing protein n=1 Tax=Orbilia ellipsospora TaxID=2528407 RepID=A0AAV9X054_9PEZI
MAVTALQMPSFAQDIFMSHPRPFIKPQQAKPKLAIPPANTMKRLLESKDADVLNKSTPSPTFLATPKRRRKSVSESNATEVPTKRRRVGKDPKPGQSPEKSAEEECTQRESYPDPRWMNEPRKYLHLRDHRYKYISKITNKLLDDEVWNKPAREYQEMMQKKTGTWMSLNQHLYPKNKDSFPPSVNPLEPVLGLILKHGAPAPEDQSQEPSIAGCFLRLVKSLPGNESLARLIDQELVEILASRERTGPEETAQQASPVISAMINNLDGLKSPRTLEPASPVSTLDTNNNNGPSSQKASPPTSPGATRTLSQDAKVVLSPSTPFRGPRNTSVQPFGPSTIPPGLSGPSVQPVYGFPIGYATYGPTVGPNQTYVDVSTSPIISASPQSAGLQFFGPQNNFTPRTHSPLGYSGRQPQMITPSVVVNSSTKTYVQQWNLDQKPMLSQDSGAVDADQLCQSYGPSQDPHSEYHTPTENTNPGLFIFPQPQRLDMSSSLDTNEIVGMNEVEFQAWLDTLNQ